MIHLWLSLKGPVTLTDEALPDRDARAGTLIRCTPTLHHPRCPCVKNLLHFPSCPFLSCYLLSLRLLPNNSPSCDSLRPSLLPVRLCRPCGNRDTLSPVEPQLIYILFNPCTHVRIRGLGSVHACACEFCQAMWNFWSMSRFSIFLGTLCYSCSMKRSPSLCSGSPGGLWPSSSHAPIPQSDWSQTVLTGYPSLCACVCACVCVRREGSMWMTAKLNARANKATGSQWERWGQDVAGSGGEMLALSPAVTHGDTVSRCVCNWLSFNTSLDEESLVLEEGGGGGCWEAVSMVRYRFGADPGFALLWCMFGKVEEYWEVSGQNRRFWIQNCRRSGRRA